MKPGKFEPSITVAEWDEIERNSGPMKVFFYLFVPILVLAAWKTIEIVFWLFRLVF